VTPQLSEHRLFDACQLLFGQSVKVDRDFLLYLQPGGARAAYRRKAKELHPDLAPSGAEQLPRRSEMFHQVVEAYELLGEFFRLKERGLWNPHASTYAVAHKKTPPSNKRGGGHYHRGPIPDITLSIGRYCYFRGIVPYQAIVEALTWQRRQRPLIGDLARRWGWLDDEALTTISRSNTIQGLFGERAVHLGLLKPFQVQTLINYQRSRQKRLGQYFVEQVYVTPLDMEQLVKDLNQHNQQVWKRQNDRCNAARQRQRASGE